MVEARQNQAQLLDIQERQNEINNAVAYQLLQLEMNEGESMEFDYNATDMEEIKENTDEIDTHIIEVPIVD